MSNISDIIEEYLIGLLDEGDNVNISRNELATYFSCAPSQINYVLTTRFTPQRGFTVESRRGGGGYITVIRLEANENDYLDEIMDIPIHTGLPYPAAFQYIQRMVHDGILTKREGDILSVVLSDKSLIAPAVSKNSLRAGIMKSVVTELLKRREKKDG